jgi:hypothetical protein
MRRAENRLAAVTRAATTQGVARLVDMHALGVRHGA